MIAAWRGKIDTLVELTNEGANTNLRSMVCCLFLHLTLCMRPHYLVNIIDYLSSHRMETLL